MFIQKIIRNLSQGLTFCCLQFLNWFANAILNSRLLCIFESRHVEALFKLYKGYTEVSAPNPHVVSGPELTIWWLSRTSEGSVPTEEVLPCSDGVAYTGGQVKHQANRHRPGRTPKLLRGFSFLTQLQGRKQLFSHYIPCERNFRDKIVQGFLN